MVDREKVIADLVLLGNAIVDGYIHEPDRAVNAITDAVALLKEQDNWLGIHQTLDGITFISSGTAKQGEKRGVMLGKALIYERIEKELLYRGLLTNDIRSTLVKVWKELE